jgi:hypothetical protein
MKRIKKLMNYLSTGWKSYRKLVTTESTAEEEVFIQAW